jgi:hypothetical protein
MLNPGMAYSPYRLRMLICKQKEVFDTEFKLDNDNH